MHSTTDKDFERLMGVATRWLWLRQNRGILTEIALDADVTVQMVSAVYWGKKTSAKVTEALRANGAPVIEKPAVNGKPSPKKGSRK